MKRVVCGLLMIFGLCPVAHAQALPEWSIWKNQRTSLLIITKVDSSNNTFIGTFINNASGFPKCVGVSVPVSGTVRGTGVSFVANFAECADTITVWKGTVSGTTITTDFDLWYVDDFKEVKGQDIFTKQN